MEMAEEARNFSLASLINADGAINWDSGSRHDGIWMHSTALRMNYDR